MDKKLAFCFYVPPSKVVEFFGAKEVKLSNSVAVLRLLQEFMPELQHTAGKALTLTFRSVDGQGYLITASESQNSTPDVVATDPVDECTHRFDDSDPNHMGIRGPIQAGPAGP